MVVITAKGSMNYIWNSLKSKREYKLVKTYKGNHEWKTSLQFDLKTIETDNIYILQTNTHQISKHD